MASPSRASYKARVGRYYKAVAELAAELGTPISESATITAEQTERFRALADESRKLDEVLAYLTTRADESESVGEWRRRRRQA